MLEETRSRGMHPALLIFLRAAASRVDCESATLRGLLRMGAVTRFPADWRGPPSTGPSNTAPVLLTACCGTWSSPALL